MNLALIQSNGKKPEYVNVNTHEVTHGGDPSGMRLNSPGPEGFYIKKKAPEPKPAAPIAAPTPAPPKLAPKPVVKPKEPIEYSPEIQQAKERVSSYEKDILSGKTSEDIYGQAQATVQSSFIKDTGSSSNDQYDFSGNTFDTNQSSKPNKQAQAAQTQMQNYISRYAKYKSSN